MFHWRKFAAAAALSSTLALGSTSAYAFNAVVGQPPEIGWGTIADALSDGTLDAGDLAGPAFQAFWAAASETITKVQICREAYAEYYSRGNNSPFTFHGNVTVVSADGETRVTYQQPIRVIPEPNGTLVVGWAKGDGRYAKAYRCGSPNAAQDDAALEAPDIEAFSGATSFSFDAPEGRISVYLPTDMAVGDRISGRVIAEPYGDTDQIRADNRARLSGYVVDVGGNEVSVAEGEFDFAIIAILIGLAVGNGENELGEAVLQVAENAAQLGSTPVAPDITQAGSPVTVPGQFDGVAGNSQVAIGGQDCPILAESPRQTTALAPNQPTGPVQLLVVDNHQNAGSSFVYEGIVNNVDIGLSAGQTTLARGQSTQLMLEVSGLQDVARPIDVAMHASASVQLQGGNDQVITIQPSDVRAGGFQRAFNLQVSTPGPFDVEASMITSTQWPYRLAQGSGRIGDEATYYVLVSSLPPQADAEP